MGVRALWQCDRDGKMFTSKKDADAYDKMLELAEAISGVLEQKVEGLSDQQTELIGRIISEQKELFSQAFKGKVDALEQIAKPESDIDSDDAEKVTPIKAAK